MYTALYSEMANAHWPLAPVANGHWPFRCIKRYTSYTRGVKEFQSYTAKTALYSAIQYTAIQRYTLYNLYITPLVFSLYFQRERLRVGDTVTSRSPYKGTSSCDTHILISFAVQRAGDHTTYAMVKRCRKRSVEAP